MKNTLLKGDMAKSSFFNTITSITAKFGTLIFTILLARLLLPEKFGAYSLIISVITIFFTLFDFGINQSLLKFYSEKNEKNKKDAYSYFIHLRNQKYIWTVVSALVLVIIAYPLSKYAFHNISLFLPLVFSAFYLFTLSIDSFYMHLFYSIKKIKYVASREVINQISKILFLIVSFYVVKESWQLMGSIAAVGLSYLISTLYLIYHKDKFVFKEKYFEPSKDDKNKMYKFGMYVALANIANTLLFSIDSIILGMYVSPEFVGYYKAAFSLLLGISGLGLAPVLILVPYLTNLSIKNQEKVVAVYTKYISMLAIPASFALLPLGKYFIVLFFGQAYLPAMYPLSIAALVIFPQIMLSGLFFAVCSARNAPNLFLWEVSITTLLNIILNFIVIGQLVKVSPLAATIGASGVYLFSWAFYFISSIFLLKNKFNIKINYSSTLKHVLASLLMIGAIYYVLSLINDFNILYGIIVILLGVIIYFAILFVLKEIRRNDVLKIISLIRGKTI